MNDENKIGRRAACAGMLALGGGLLLAKDARGKQSCNKSKSSAPPKCENGDFYKPDGGFDQERAKRACLDLAKHYGYPVNDAVREKFFVSDFGLGRFAEVGLGGIAWLNDKQGNYASFELFLLPDQMIPEHWHVPLPDEGILPKMESWIVRYGSTYAYGEGDPTPKLSVKVHDCQKKHVTARHETAVRPGEVAGIGKPLEKHWQQAGPGGCIMTEVSSYHAGAAIRFTDPNVKF